MVYFWSYLFFKDNLIGYLGDKPTTIQTGLINFASSAIAEAFALLIYYPFDLIKTRMQTSYGDPTLSYNNIIDALIKIWQEEPVKDSFLTKIRRLYCGLGLYGATYIVFIALEFSLYEVFMQII
jgi:hypothetical protein